MRAVGILCVLGVACVSASAAVSGCQDATQATLTITLEKEELCPSLGGTAITVGVDPLDTEQRVADSYVTAVEPRCDPATGMIGTLVITPGESAKASVVVVVAFDKARAPTPAACKPPDYPGCIVARRLFAFNDHKNLQMPITVDTACVDVPCDAVSTCRHGNCYSSEVAESCVGRACEPGVSEDGGIPDGGIVEAGGDSSRNDGSSADGSSTDGSSADGSSADGSSTDGSSTDGSSTDGSSGTVPYCTPGATPVLMCQLSAGSPSACGGANPACCGAGAAPICTPACVTPERRCCSNTDCGASECCPPADGGTAPRFCMAGGAKAAPRMGLISSCADIIVPIAPPPPL